MTEQSNSEQEKQTTDRVFEALAKSLALYYEAEKAFMTEPGSDNAVRYVRASEDFNVIRQHIRQQVHLAVSVSGVEQDESVGR